MSADRQFKTLVEKADAALEQAAMAVLRRAQATGGTILIWDSGKPREARPEDFLDENGQLK